MRRTVVSVPGPHRHDLRADVHRDFELDPGTTKTADPNVIVDDADINMVVEVMGGNTVAKDVLFKALQRGKHVVTANKALLAAELPAIIAALRESPVRLWFASSSFAAAAPVRGVRVFHLVSNDVAAPGVPGI